MAKLEKWFDADEVAALIESVPLLAGSSETPVEHLLPDKQAREVRRCVDVKWGRAKAGSLDAALLCRAVAALVRVYPLQEQVAMRKAELKVLAKAARLGS